MVDVSSTPENNTKPASERFPNQKSRRFFPIQLQHQKRVLGPSSSTRRTASASLQQRLLCAEAQLLLNKVPAGRVAINARGVLLLVGVGSYFHQGVFSGIWFWVDEGAVAINPLLWFENKQIVAICCHNPNPQAIRRCFHVFFG